MRNEECNGHGQKKNNVTGLCICNEGFKPPLCIECTAGYVLDLNNDCKLANSCKIDSCGCLPNKPSDICSPIGICTPLPRAQIKCDCLYPNYTGVLCKTCAEGYLKYPECIKAIPCPQSCKNGVCNNLTGQCDCEGNFGLPTCEKCIDGFTGSNCTTKLEENSPAIYIILGVIGMAIVIIAVIYILKNRDKYCTLNQGNDYVNIPLTTPDEENKISIEGSDDLEVDFASSSMEEKKSEHSQEDKESGQKEEKLIDF